MNKLNHAVASLFIWILIALIGLWIDSIKIEWLTSWAVGFLTGIACAFVQSVHHDLWRSAND